MTTASTTRETKPWLVLMTLCLGFFMIMLDTTIVNIALPSMLDGLHLSLDQSLWVVNAYLMAYAMLLITAGRLGDIFGPRNLFVAGLVLFTISSIACGLADNAWQIITARAVQGVGGALLTPQTLAIIAAVFPRERRGAAMGVWSAVVGLATVAGPTVGGVLVNDASWRWIFYVNVPIGVIALVGTYLYVPDLRPGRSHRFDLVGVALASAALFLLVFGLVEGQRYDWGEFRGGITIPMVLIAGAALLAAFIAWEFRPKEPLLPLKLFRIRNFSLMNAVQCFIAFGMLGIYLPVVLVLQSVLGMSALRAGLTLAPWSVATMFTAPVAGRLADKHGGKYVLMAGMALFGLGLGLMITAVHTDATLTSFLLPGIIAGAGLGFSLAPLTAEAMRDVPMEQAGAASGMLNAMRQLGGLLGTAVVGSVLQNQLSDKLRDEALTRSGGVPADARTPFVDAFNNAADHGLQVAPGSNGGVKLPAGATPQDTASIKQVAHDVFTHGFVNAAKPTIAVPTAVVFAGVLFVLGMARRKPAPAPAAPDAKPDAATGRAPVARAAESTSS
ncbi:MFS transporter [Yinghuangia seranimata]|uniref:MFS transporter n=1 Tax=Yinghuangia seranimata TaxID=408067 RepID=UPI00248B4910|nr:MFS transporter [Yinghuangia seranimata]MDI2127672.1 MFS transporter [Yinghuangia seranimata]